jgi:hypothetical protein
MILALPTTSMVDKSAASSAEALELAVVQIRIVQRIESIVLFIGQLLENDSCQ